MMYSKLHRFFPSPFKNTRPLLGPVYSAKLDARVKAARVNANADDARVKAKVLSKKVLKTVAQKARVAREAPLIKKVVKEVVKKTFKKMAIKVGKNVEKVNKKKALSSRQLPIESAYCCCCCCCC
jgi:hypothetical protein